MLIVARGLQGIGGGGITPLAQSIVADMVTPRERGHYQAYMGSTWVVAGVVGPALGGVIADQLHWSVIFWLNVPLGLVAALLISTRLKRLPRHERPHKLDLLGAALMTAAAIALLLALTSGGTRFAWLSAHDLRPGRGLHRAHRVVRLVAAAGAGAVPAAHRAGQSGDACRHLATACGLGVMTGFMIYHAALLSGRA